MKPDQERLALAAHAALLFLYDLQEIHKSTRNRALEELILPLIGQTRVTAQLLQRLSEN